jgi:hypothetical protein
MRRVPWSGQDNQARIVFSLAGFVGVGGQIYLADARAAINRSSGRCTGDQAFRGVPIFSALQGDAPRQFAPKLDRPCVAGQVYRRCAGVEHAFVYGRQHRAVFGKGMLDIFIEST